MTPTRTLLLAKKLSAIAVRVKASEESLRLRGNTAAVELAKLGAKLCDVLAVHACDMWNRHHSRQVTDRYAADQAVAIWTAVLHLSETFSSLLAPEELTMPSQGIILPIDDLVRAIRPDCTVLIRGQYIHNYEAFLEVRSVLEKLLPQVLSREEVFRGFPTKFFVLNFPAVEARNTLLHALLAHEVGHIIFQELRLESIPQELLQGGTWLEELRDIFTQLHQVVRTDPAFAIKFAGFQAKVSRVVLDWFKELVSDLFGARLVGPCYLFALREFGLLGYPLDSSIVDDRLFKEYPSLRRRLSLICQEAQPYLDQEFRFTDKTRQEKVLSALRAEVESCRNLAWGAAAVLPQPYEFARNLVDVSLDEVHSRIDSEPLPYLFKPSLLADEMFELYQRIADDISPNEVLNEPAPPFGRPAHWQSILNAAWAYRLLSPEGGLDTNPFHAKDDLVNGDGVAQQHGELTSYNDFIARSIELSIVHRRFEAYRATWGELLQ